MGWLLLEASLRRVQDWRGLSGGDKTKWLGLQSRREARSAGWRRRAGSNRRIAVLQTAPLATWVRRHGSDYRRGSFRNSTAKNGETEETSTRQPAIGRVLTKACLEAQECRGQWWTARPARALSLPNPPLLAHPTTRSPRRRTLQLPFPLPTARLRESACP